MSLQLNDLLAALVEKKIFLATLDYNDERYDAAEDSYHDLEDTLTEEYGDLLEDALADVHDEHCPDTDVLHPTAYLAKSYLKSETEGPAVQYDIPYGEGVPVDSEDYPKHDVRLVLLPNPTRIILSIKGVGKKVVWTHEG